jgi:hypothetical protein
MSRIYHLHGLTIAAASNDPAVQQALGRTLRYKGAEMQPEPRLEPKAESTPPDQADLRLFFDRDAGPSWPEAATHLGTGDRVGVEVWSASEQMLLRWKETVVTCLPRTGIAQGFVSNSVLTAHREKRRSPLFYLITLSLVILLRHRGWYPLHTAALTREGRGVLLVGPSDRGKSTAALNLVRSGWGYLSDDTVLLRQAGGETQAYSFRRNFCVDPDATEHFPELGAQTWPSSLSDASKWQVDIEDVYPGQFQPCCTPRILLLPEIVDASRSRVEPADPKTALSALLTQGAFFLVPNRDIADSHLDVLGILTRQSKTYHLQAGRDARDDPGALDALVQPLIDENGDS